MLNSWPLAKDLQVLVEIVHSGSFSAASGAVLQRGCQGIFKDLGAVGEYFWGVG